ncbi:hypothetical protein DBZ36_18290 [Alginatibacterium sediminis]|uniref:DUF6868 domain-containing protein n=1 Tax=Alginatibacterium sediminis TaxID=2164068 RepID=A0A420E6L4_9ALTE|nr:hypothetical protein [Alginatibacterium sediminis]RKF13721.1 hypothetical protein DBZ36_18290 [Alginatibacterium sediminis]
MFSIAEFTSFLGWCVVINAAVLLFSTLGLYLGKNVIVRIHSRAFDLDAQQLRQLYMQYIAYFKLLTLLFFFAPYVALKIMGY